MLSRHPHTRLFALLFLFGCGGDSWTAFGGCLIDGNVERPEWLARVQETGSHPAWRNTPVATAVEIGTTLEVVNVGGRPHSFTRVANYGGGILPMLNTREDTRIPAPECLAGFVRIEGAGGSIPHTFTGVGEQRYQCCFHPWMRTTVMATESHGH
jgi:plastocyanin